MKKITLTFLFLALASSFANAQDTLKADFAKKIKEATPKPLPQTPVAEKLKSDAEDEGLKGKVKSVVGERQGLTGIEKPIGKRMASITEFDESGNFLKQVSFDYRGVPYYVTVYGNIDGARVSTSNSVNTGQEFRLSVGINDSLPKTETNKPDPRYEYKYGYKYKDGKLAEMQIITNTGSKWLRSVYNHKINQREELVYTDENELNRKYLYILDDKGNEIERVDFDVRQPKTPQSGKFSFKYEAFDEQGNWTRRIFSKLEVENGKEVYKPLAIEYRTITYYQ